MSLQSETVILEFRNSSFSYGKGSPFIREVSFSVGQGEFIGLLGPNGSGKSTILKLGSGLLNSSAGDVILWRRPVHEYRNRDRAKLISYLPQTLDMGIPFTVRELVGMGLYPYDIPPAMTADEAIGLVSLEDKADSNITELSGGERRRTFIAMTLLQGAGLLLLDEPLANLDIKYQIELVRLLRRLRDERNISILMALHDINIALQFEKVVLIRDGRLLGMGSPELVFSEDRIRDAFGVEVRIIRQQEGKSYISYEENFMN